MSKRCRLVDDNRAHTSHDGNTYDPPFSPGGEHNRTGYGSENTDTLLSSATASSRPLRGYAHDPDYLASQEASRSLMFDTARSVAPTRRGTSVDGDE